MDDMDRLETNVEVKQDCVDDKTEKLERKLQQLVNLLTTQLKYARDCNLRTTKLRLLKEAFSEAGSRGDKLSTKAGEAQGEADALADLKRSLEFFQETGEDE